ncbi:hypothetical protein ABT112_27250 [Streptomyces sp. NPDC002055]|uniref:hypothetical protein n=1 Tax=Streptomyces sp. NPDC002055 TaxID=3154534 RepID=UPI0033293D5B
MVREQQGEVSEDAVMTRIGQTVMLHRAGDREEARNRFAQLWAEIGEAGDPLHRCTLAHYMADTQDDPADELVWDVRALRAADSHAGSRSPSASRTAVAVRAFYPSIHLNLAADYVKLRRPEAARRALRRARESARVLGDDEYGDGVRAAIARLELRLGGSTGDPAPPGGHLP